MSFLTIPNGELRQVFTRLQQKGKQDDMLADQGSSLFSIPLKQPAVKTIPAPVLTTESCQKQRVAAY